MIRVVVPESVRASRYRYDACPLCGATKVKSSRQCNACRFSPAVVYWPKVDQSRGPEACWPWTGYIDRDDYGRCELLGQQRAHQVAFVLAFGPVPDGLEIDHLCRSRSCCNPAHLEAVTHAENRRRSRGYSRRPHGYRTREVAS